MRFIISRASDEFMECEHPNPNWSPHPAAVFSREWGHWVVEVKSVENLLDLLKQDEQLVIVRNIDGISSIQIDDVTASIRQPTIN